MGSSHSRQATTTKQDNRASCFLCGSCSSSCVVGSDAHTFSKTLGTQRYVPRSLLSSSPQGPSSTQQGTSQVLPVVEVLSVARQVVATHFPPPKPLPPPTPAPLQQLECTAMPLLSVHSSTGMQATGAFSPNCSSSSNVVPRGKQISEDSVCLSPDFTSPMFYHTLGEEVTTDGTVTSCTVTTTTAKPRIEGMEHGRVQPHHNHISAVTATVGPPAHAHAAARSLRPALLEIPSPPGTPHHHQQQQHAAPSPSKASWMLLQPPSPAVATWQVDPVMVAALMLMHSQGRQERHAGRFSSRSKEPDLLQLQQPMGLCQLPGHIIHWLACDCGYSAYGSPPKARQLPDAHTAAYFCAAFCQVVGEYLRTWGRCPDTHAISPATHPVLYTAQRLAGSTCSHSSSPHNPPSGTLAVSPHVVPASQPILCPTSQPLPPFITALWPDTPTNTTAAAGIGTGSMNSTGAWQSVGPSPWFDHHCAPPLPHFDYQDPSSYVHVIVCTYHTHARSPCSPTDEPAMLQAALGSGGPGPGPAVQETSVLRMAWAQYSEAEQHLTQLQSALMQREKVGAAGQKLGAAEQKAGPAVEEVVTMYLAGAGDTLSSIAAAVQVSEEALLVANPGLCADPVLRPHDCLALPVASILPKLYCIQPSETLCTVASKHGVTLHKLLVCNSKLRKLNPRAPLPGWVVELPGLFGQV